MFAGNITNKWFRREKVYFGDRENMGMLLNWDGMQNPPSKFH